MGVELGVGTGVSEGGRMKEGLARVVVSVVGDESSERDMGSVRVVRDCAWMGLDRAMAARRRIIQRGGVMGALFLIGLLRSMELFLEPRLE